MVETRPSRHQPSRNNEQNVTLKQLQEQLTALQQQQLETNRQNKELLTTNRNLQQQLQDIHNHEENGDHSEPFEDYVTRLVTQRGATIQVRANLTNLLDHPIETPFSDEIMNTEFPDSVKPRIELFNGDRDPQEHLDAYKSAMISFRANDAYNKWFLRLPPKSVRRNCS